MIDELAKMRAKKRAAERQARIERGVQLHEEVERMIAEGTWELRNLDELIDEVTNEELGLFAPDLFLPRLEDDDGGPDAA